jgi:transposase
MRATRDLLRRRLHLVRRRGNLLAHVQNTHHQYNLPEPSAKVAYKANREGIAEAFEEGDARKSLEVDFALIEHYDEVIRELELHLVRRAKQHDAQAFHRLRSVPGIGKILALTILYEIHDVARFERVQNFLSYARLVKCEHSSAGKKLGTGGAKIGNVHLKWAFSEAAVLFLRNNPAGQRHLRRLAGRHGKAKALSILAAKIGRAVYFMLKRERAFEMERFLAHS